MNFFPQRLKSARKIRGFSLQDLSDALGNHWNKQFLNRLELGESSPDGSILEALCITLGLSQDYFFKEDQIEIKDIEFRKLKKLPNREQERVIHQTMEVIERYIELENHLCLEHQAAFKIKKVKVSNGQEAEDAAIRFRDELNLGDEAIYKVVVLLENINVKVILEEFDPSFSGMSTVINDSILVIVLNNHTDIPIVRKRFTAMHELAHLYLNLEGLEEKVAERLCDRFAGAMLLPEIKVKSYFGERRTQIILKELQLLASDFGISMAAILYRCMELEIITPSYHKYYMINYNKWNTKLKEYSVFINEEKSDRFLQLLLRAVAEEVISMSKAASLNNQKLGDFRDIIDNID